MDVPETQIAAANEYPARCMRAAGVEPAFKFKYISV